MKLPRWIDFNIVGAWRESRAVSALVDEVTSAPLGEPGIMERIWAAQRRLDASFTREVNVLMSYWLAAMVVVGTGIITIAVR